MTGQGAEGGWSYTCANPLTDTEATRLKKVFANETKLVSDDAKNRPAKKNAPKIEQRPDLPPPEATNEPANKTSLPRKPKNNDRRSCIRKSPSGSINWLMTQGEMGEEGMGSAAATIQIRNSPRSACSAPASMACLAIGISRPSTCDSAPAKTLTAAGVIPFNRAAMVHWQR